MVSLWFQCWFLLVSLVSFDGFLGWIIYLNILGLVLRIILRALDCDLWLPKVGGYI